MHRSIIIAIIIAIIMANDKIDKNNNKSNCIVVASYWANNIMAMQSLTLNSENDCPICFHQITNPKETCCKHKMCTECLNTWLLSHNTCPICRQIQFTEFKNKNQATDNIRMYGLIINMNRILSGLPPLTYSS